MDIKTILNLLGQYHLTADELLLIYLTFLAQDEEGHPELFKQWFDSGGNEQLRGLFNSLKEKGVIRKDYNPEVYVPNDIEFNKNFLKTWPKHSNEFGMQLFETYPPMLQIKGTYYPARDYSKRFASLEDFCYFYSKEIGHNEEKHKKVMDILHWAKDNGLLNFGILSFVVGHQWDALEQLRDNPELIPICQTGIMDE